MKRKEFIRNISLLGVGLSLTPTRLFALSDQSRIALPNQAVHIPHGNFANTDIERIRIAELDVEVSVQRFMRNGISISEQDISVFTFWKNQEVLNMCFDDSGCHVSGALSGLKTSTSERHFLLSNNRFELEINPARSCVLRRKI